MSEGETRLQDIENDDCEVFRSRNKILELCFLIQILVIEWLEDVLTNDTVDVNEVADHPGRTIDLAADGDFNGVIMAMAIRIVAFAIGLTITLLGECLIVQAMRSRNPVTPR
jgi:hypothetical protein